MNSKDKKERLSLALRKNLKKRKTFQKKVAEKYGYKLVDHKLELYGVKVNSKDE